MNRGTKGALFGIFGFIIVVVVVLLVWANVCDMSIAELIRSWVGGDGMSQH